MIIIDEDTDLAVVIGSSYTIDEWVHRVPIVNICFIHFRDGNRSLVNKQMTRRTKDKSQKIAAR